MYQQQALKKYKLVKIQDLPRKEQICGKFFQQEEVVSILRQASSKEDDVYCCIDTGLKERFNVGSNQYLMGFLQPYNQHGDILLVPDDVWLSIIFFVSRYIDERAEKLRSKFVTHSGQKQLNIRQIAHSQEHSLALQKQWDHFFDRIIEKVRENTKPGAVEALECDFSTTNKLYKVISTSIIMSSFKAYFRYSRTCGMCGINNVYFDGVREDWVKLISKLQKLSEYDIDGVLTKYIDHMEAILLELLETYDGNPNAKWWNTVITSEEERGMSGRRGGTYLQGWLLNVFGMYGKTHIKDIPSSLIKVPIKLTNQWTKTVKHLQLRADWVSVSKVSENVYKPDVGMCIIQEKNEKLQKR